MNILFIGDFDASFRNMEPILWPLYRRGHRLRLWLGEKTKPGLSDAGIKSFVSATQNIDIGRLVPRQDHWAGRLWTSRDLLTYSIYCKREHPSPHLIKRCYYLSGYQARKTIESKWGKWLLPLGISRAVLRMFEKLTPPDPVIKQRLMEEKPDILVAVSNLNWHTPVVDYVKAALDIHIPTVLLVASWDNLTTKSTFHVFPDEVLVWNEGLVNEAVTLHDVPRKKILITGAPTFDYLFETKPSCDYSSFCMKLGIPADKPFIVYLGSSASISGDETSFAAGFLTELSKRHDVSVVLRPHPFNCEIWENFSAPNLVVWPKGGAWPDMPSSRQALYDTLYHCKAAVGVNTSAMLEAAILDKPCVTIMTDTYRKSQAESGHFQHLVRADFLETAHDYLQANDIIGRILEGEDGKAQNRRRFVREFIRPRGLVDPPGELVARIVELAAQGQSMDRIKKIVNFEFRAA